MWYLEVWVDGRDKPLKKYKNIGEEKFTRLLRKIESLSKRIETFIVYTGMKKIPPDPILF